MNISAEKPNKLFEDMYLYEMSMTTFFDGVGLYGPIIVYIIVTYALVMQPKYLWIYIIASVANVYLNRYLKLTFLEKRPEHPIAFSKYEKYKNADKYGMPSGHASAIGWSVIYLLLVKAHSIWLPLCVFIGILTLYQRVKYRRHTVQQVAIGFITGGVYGWIVYSLATQWIIYYSN